MLHEVNIDEEIGILLFNFLIIRVICEHFRQEEIQLFQVFAFDTDVRMQLVALALQRNNGQDSTQEPVSFLEELEHFNSFGNNENRNDQGTSQLVISTLPHIMGEKLEKIEECLICLDLFQKDQLICILPCLHKFHADCANKWLLINAHCPVCKNKIS